MNENTTNASMDGKKIPGTAPQFVSLELKKGINLSENDIAKFCKEKGINPEQSVFIFPGNNGHHGGNNSLHSSKSGSGLANLAGSLWQISMPTLSLPTVVYKSNDTNLYPVGSPLAISAVADIWRAIGYGLNIVLPVRTHNNQTFFSKSINGTTFEPAFWGAINPIPNLAVAKIYLTQLENIRLFLSANPGEKAKFLEWLKIKFKPAYDAYQEGLTNKTSSSPSAWFTAGKKPQIAKTETTVLNKSAQAMTDDAPIKDKPPLSSAPMIDDAQPPLSSVPVTKTVSLALSRTTTERRVGHFKNLAPLSEAIRTIISAPDALNINASQSEQLINALDKLQQVEQEHSKSVLKQATKIGLEQAVERSKFWTIAKEIFTSIHPNGGYVFDLNFKKGKLVSLDKMNFRTNGKQDRHVTPISVIKHLFEEQLQKDMTPDEARIAILSQLETFQSGIETNLRTSKANRRIVDYLEKLDADKKPKSSEALFNLIMDLYSPEEQKIINSILSDAFKAPIVLEVVKEEIIHKLEEFEDDIPAHIIINYFKTNDFTKDPDPIKNLETAIRPYFSKESLKELTKLFTEVLKKPFDLKVAQEKILTALEEDEFGKYDNKKMEVARYVQAIFDYYSHPGTVEDEDHLKELLKIVAHFYNEKAQLVISDGYIPIPDKTPDRYLIPTLDFGGVKFFYDKNKDKKLAKKDSDSDNEDDTKKEKKDAEGTFINMQNKILTGLNWILLMGTDDDDHYKLENNLAFKTLKFSQKTISHINERSAQIKDAIKIAENMVDLSDNKKMLTEQELNQAIYAIYAMFDYMPLPEGVNNPDGKKFDANRHRYVGEPKSRLFEVAANHLQFVFAAYPQLKEYYGDEIRDGFLRYVAYGVTEKNLNDLGIAKKLKKKKIDIKQFTNTNDKGRVYGFGSQYTDKSPVSVKNFYDEMQQKVEEILIIRDSSFHNDMDSNPLSPPSSPDFDSQIFQDTDNVNDLAAVILYLHHSYDKSLNEDFSKLPESLKKILHLEGEDFNALFQRKLSNITNLKPMDTSVENRERDDEDYLPENLQIFNAIKQAYSEWPQKQQFSGSTPSRSLIPLVKALKNAMRLKAENKSNGYDSSDSEDDDEDDDEIIEKREIWQEFLQGLYLLNDDQEKLTNTAPMLNISGPRRIMVNNDNHGIFNAMTLGIADLALTDQLSNNVQRQAFYTFLQKELILDVSTLPPDAAFKLWLKDKSESEIQQKLSPLLRKFVASKIDEKYNRNYQYYYTTALQAAFNSFLQGKLHENITFGAHPFIQAAFDMINKDVSVIDKMQAINNWWLKGGAKQYFTNIQSKEHSLKLWNSDVEIAALGMELGVSFNLKGTSNDMKGGLIPFDWSNPKHVWLAYWLRERNMGDFYFGHFKLNQFAGITDLKQLLGPASANAAELLKGFLSKNQLEQPIVCTDENTALISELVQRGILSNKDNSNKFYLTTRSIPHINARLEGLPSTPIVEVTAEALSRHDREHPILRNHSNANYFDKLLQRGIYGYRNDKKDGNIYLIAPANQLAAQLQGFNAEDRKLIEDNYQPAIQQPIVIERSAEYCTYVRPMAIRKQLEPNIVDEPIIQKKTSGKTWQNTNSKNDSKDRPEKVPTEADGNCAFNAMALGIADLVKTDLLPENAQRQPFYTFLQKELNLDISFLSKGAAFKLWLKDKSNVAIQKTLAPLLRKYAVIKINEQYPANYQEGYEGLLKWAFDLYLQGKSREDDTFAVHDFITKQFKALNQKYGKLDDNKAEDKEKVKNRENELIDWWSKTGKVEYFKALSQPALSAGDLGRWGSDVEPAALAFNLGIGYNWRKFGAEQSLSIGSGLIPVSENLIHLQQLRNRGVGDFYSGSFRLEEFPDLEHLKQLLAPAKQETVDSLNEFLQGDPKRPFVLSKPNPLVENELIQRKILTRKLIDKKPVWFLADLTKEEMNARLIALPELTAKLATDHYQPNIPKLTIENSGGHWTYLRTPEISKKLALVSAPPNVDIPKAPTKLPEAENIPPIISKQNLVTEDLIAAVKTKIDCASLNIKYLDNNFQLSVKDGAEGKVDRRKLINFLEDNEITYNASPLQVTVDNNQMELIKKLLSPELLNPQPKKELTPPDKGASTEVPALKHAQTAPAVNKPGNSTHPKWGRIATEHQKQHTEAQDQTKGKAKGTIQFGAKRKILDADPNMEKGVHSAKKENEKGSVDINAANIIPNDQSTKKESENGSVDINAANTTPSDVKRRKANETPDSDNALVDDSNKASPPSTISTFVRRDR